MEIILIILTSAIMGAINVASFYFGYKEGKKVKDDNKVELTKENMPFVKELANLMSYTGEEQ